MKEIDKLLKRFENAQRVKDEYTSLFAKCYRYALPHRNQFDSQSKGDDRTIRIFDSTAPSSVAKFVSKLQRSLVPPYRRWCELRSSEDADEIILKSGQNLKEYAEEATEKFFYHLDRSNFNEQASETFYDLAVGTSCLLFQEDTTDSNSAFKFSAVSLYDIFLEKDDDAKNVWRRFEVEAQFFYDKYPLIKPTTELKEYISKNPEGNIELIEGTIKEGNKTIYFLIWKEKKQMLHREEYDLSPFIVSRWAVMPNAVYGTGQVQRLISDIETANIFVKSMREAAEFASAGAYTVVHDGVINPFNTRIKPRAAIKVASNE